MYEVNDCPNAVYSPFRHSSDMPAVEKGDSAELIAEDQLIHLKSYRYQSVDKSLISRYILKHYVRTGVFCPTEGKPCAHMLISLISGILWLNCCLCGWLPTLSLLLDLGLSFAMSHVSRSLCQT
jgi:hypothetical protein